MEYKAMHVYFGMFWWAFNRMGPAFALQTLQQITANIVRVMAIAAVQQHNYR
jgi:hypothetical protein